MSTAYQALCCFPGTPNEQAVMVPSQGHTKDENDPGTSHRNVTGCVRTVRGTGAKKCSEREEERSRLFLSAWRRQMTPGSIQVNQKLVPGKTEESHYWKRGKKGPRNRLGSHAEDPCPGTGLLSCDTKSQCVTLDKLLCVIMPRLLHLQNRNNKGSTSWGIL